MSSLGEDLIQAMSEALAHAKGENVNMDYQELARKVAHLATELSTAINLHVDDEKPVTLEIGSRSEAAELMHSLVSINRVLQREGNG